MYSGVRSNIKRAVDSNSIRSRSKDQQGYGLRKPTSSVSAVTTSLRRTSLVETRGAEAKGVFKPAPPTAASGMQRNSGAEEHQSSASATASTIVEDTRPVFDEMPPCKNPLTHAGSASRPPLSDFFTQRSWIKGPAQPSGVVVNLSDRPCLCMSVHGSELAVGSSDHAVYTVDVHTCGLTRIMHGKSYGHTEWVTCVDHLPDGRIISGGMDNKLCLWDTRGVRSRDLKGHTASVSGVKAGLFNQGNIAVSGSYDRTMILWDVAGAQGREVGRLTAHKAPVMEFAGTTTGKLVSGCRDGTVILWDVNTRTPVLQCKNAHKGHVTALQSLQDNVSELFLTGGQDGLLQVWDFRYKKPVHTACLHRSIKGVGALSCIAVSRTTTCGCPLVTTAGADRIIKVLDVRGSFNVVHTLTDHKDFIYSLYMNGSLALSGGGDGSLLVHDVERGKCLYALGAINNGAVRGISLAGESQEKLVVTGDDGNVMIYSL